MKHPDDPADLANEARRRSLSREEELRFEALLEESPEEDVAYRAGLAFDRDSSAREGDDVLVARLASRAAERFGAPPSVRPSSRPLRRSRSVVLLVAAVVAAGTAAAGTGVA